MEAKVFIHAKPCFSFLILLSPFPPVLHPPPSSFLFTSCREIPWWTWPNPSLSLHCLSVSTLPLFLRFLLSQVDFCSSSTVVFIQSLNDSWSVVANRKDTWTGRNRGRLVQRKRNGPIHQAWHMAWPFIYHLFTHFKFDMEMYFRVSGRSVNRFINKLTTKVISLFKNNLHNV